MIDLAQHDAGGFIPPRDISRRQEISAKYLEQIVVQLSRAGFVRSIRGAQGGYQLSRPPAEYTVGDILRITEGSLAPVACLESEPVECPRAGDGITLDFWRGLFDTINQYVDSVTLEDLIQPGDSRWIFPILKSRRLRPAAFICLRAVQKLFYAEEAAPCS